MERYGSSRRSRGIIESIAAFIEARVQVSSAEVGAYSGLSAATVSRYLRHMCEVGVIHLAARHSTNPGSHHAALYGYGAPRSEAAIRLKSGARGGSRSAWPQGRALRDPLVAALFGPAHGLAACATAQQLTRHAAGGVHN